MGVGGVPWRPEEKDVIETLIRNSGKMCNSAKELGVDYHTLFNYLNKRPALWDLKENLRKGYTNKLVDKAEDVLDFALDQKEEDLNNAMKSAMFICNNLGQDRGYNHPNALVSDALKSSFDNLNSAIEKQYKKKLGTDGIIAEANERLHGEQCEDKPS